VALLGSVGFGGLYVKVCGICKNEGELCMIEFVSVDFFAGLIIGVGAGIVIGIRLLDWIVGKRLEGNT